MLGLHYFSRQLGFIITKFVYRGRVRRKRVISKMNTVRDEDYLLSISSCTDRNQSRCGPSPNSDQETSLLTLKDRLRRLGQKLQEVKLIFLIYISSTHGLVIIELSNHSVGQIFLGLSSLCFSM